MFKKSVIFLISGVVLFNQGLNSDCGIFRRLRESAISFHEKEVLDKLSYEYFSREQFFTWVVEDIFRRLSENEKISPFIDIARKDEFINTVRASQEHNLEHLNALLHARGKVSRTALYSIAEAMIELVPEFRTEHGWLTILQQTSAIEKLVTQDIESKEIIPQSIRDCFLEPITYSPLLPADLGQVMMGLNEANQAKYSFASERGKVAQLFGRLEEVVRNYHQNMANEIRGKRDAIIKDVSEFAKDELFYLQGFLTMYSRELMPGDALINIAKRMESKIDSKANILRTRIKMEIRSAYAGFNSLTPSEATDKENRLLIALGESGLRKDFVVGEIILEFDRVKDSIRFFLSDFSRLPQ